MPISGRAPLAIAVPHRKIKFLALLEVWPEKIVYLNNTKPVLDMIIMFLILRSFFRVSKEVY